MAKSRMEFALTWPTSEGAIVGAKELQIKLRHLAEVGSKRAIVAGIRAAMPPLAKAMRAAINSSEASPELKREARKTIGARFGKTRAIQERHAKVGFGVGMRAAAIGRAMTARGKRIAAGKQEKKGVGISAANIHWFVLGTDDRYSGGTRRRVRKTAEMAKGFTVYGGSGLHPTGRIRNIFGQVTRLAFASSAAAMVEAARVKINEVIQKEADRK